MPRALRAVAALTVAAVTVVACSGEHGFDASAGRTDCISDFDPAADYFPEKSTVLDATNFTLDYHRSYQILTVAQPYPGGRPASYVLVRCGAPDPELPGELAHAQRVTVPVTGLYSASTTHLGMLAELDATGAVTGVADPGYVVDPHIRERIRTGRTVGFAPGRQTNVETVIGAHPDVLVTGGTDDPSHPKLRSAGISVVADAEWLESSPLGRAEWIKVFAALTGTEKKAGEVYAGLSARYRTVAEQASRAAPADVLPGSMYQGSWSMPTGAGYAGRLILDAGGRYPWAARTGAESLQLNFESVYAHAGAAPVWLVARDWATVNDAVAADARYAALSAVRDGQVWSATGGARPGTGGAADDYWERGTARPDLVLADLAAILHPELAPQHRFAFYGRVAA